MNYPLARHYQRYEYVIQSGLVTDRNVLDVGCGYGYGTNILAKEAKNVLGIDLSLGHKNNLMSYMECYKPRKAVQLEYMECDIFDFKPNITFDVAVCVEVFEHVPDPVKFIARLAEIAAEVFITTPLARVTAPTRNPEHVNEYTHEDFLAAIETKFVPQRIRFQTGNMNIEDYGIYTGDSMDPEHTVQMVYATRR